MASAITFPICAMGGGEMLTLPQVILFYAALTAIFAIIADLWGWI